MKFYFAPMEGLTGYIYRNAHATYFNAIDKYFMPFIASNQYGKLSSREKNDILPEHNQNKEVIPQILTNNADDFIRTAKQLHSLGYNEVNLNIGCPSGTVVSKGKGSGFLAYPKELDAFLDTIYSELDMKISVKTRIGKDVPEEFYQLIQIFNQYPIEELIIHPRVQKDYYKNTPHMQIFEVGFEESKNPVCYNGDVFTVEDFNRFTTTFPNVDRLMIGRGLLANPYLVNEILYGGIVDKIQLKTFHDHLYEDYREVLSGDRNLLFKMKESWYYMIHMFSSYEKYAKKIKKSQNARDYEDAVEHLFQEQEIIKGNGFLPPHLKV